MPAGGRAETFLKHPLNPLRILERQDKWFLANGRGAMYAPPFPRWLESIGFWDECYWAEVRLERLFAALVLDERFRPLPLRLIRRRWRPDRLTQEWAAQGLRIRETRVVVGRDVFASKLEVRNAGAKERRLNLILWSMPECGVERAGAPAAHGVRIENGAALLALKGRAGEGEYALHLALAADRKPTSHTINLSEWADTSPTWQVAPFAEKVRKGLLAGDEKVDFTTEGRGLLHIGLHYRLRVGPGAAESITFGCAVAPEPGAALPALREAFAADVAATSEREWKRFFESVPYFECDDEYLTRYYWYRWYGLRLLMVSACRGMLRHPCVFEGIDGFRWHISYSAQCHMRECRWMHFASLAEGSLLNFLANQLESGSLPGHIGVHSHDQGFYHADWGDAALAVYAIHEDKGFLKTIYEPLVRYAEYFERERDRENLHLYDVLNQGETGQEYSSRYLFADPEADKWGPIRLKGVDGTVYMYNLQRSLARIAAIIDRPQDARRWQQQAALTRAAILAKMWDEKRKEFCDFSAEKSQRSPYSPSVAFYPFFTDLPGKRHLPALKEHLLNPKRFWTRFPVPTVALDDPYFSAEAEWKGKRHSCPWNGRVWPMTNSHACEALAAALRLDASLKKPAAELIKRFVRMMFFDGDVNRPNCFEHYNPHSGLPCTYRGIDDYQHSWVVDLILKYVAGVQPQLEKTLIVAPLPFGLRRFRVDRMRYKGCWVKVAWDTRAGLRVYVDGKLRAQRRNLARVEIAL
jgi:hypothetical protein